MVRFQFFFGCSVFVMWLNFFWLVMVYVEVVQLMLLCWVMWQLFMVLVRLMKVLVDLVGFQNSEICGRKLFFVCSVLFIGWFLVLLRLLSWVWKFMVLKLIFSFSVLFSMMLFCRQNWCEWVIQFDVLLVLNVGLYILNGLVVFSGGFLFSSGCWYYLVLVVVLFFFCQKLVVKVCVLVLNCRLIMLFS